MLASTFTGKVKALGAETLIGVPDSTLKEFCDYIRTEGKDEFNHYTTPNEGSAVGMAMGVYLSTGKPACVYMQNSGLGNIVNPVTSLANKAVYDVPMLFVIGWRGEPGKKDEPQHVFMGEITTKQLDVLDIEYSIIGGETTDEELGEVFEKAAAALSSNLQYAIIVKKGTFEKSKGEKPVNGYEIIREEAIGEILKSLDPSDYVVSTTGKISREVYEQSDIVLGQHKQHFLTVGGMGHASMIALGIAKNTDKKVYCIDGDGAVLMHMGGLAFIGAQQPENFVHVCINNDSHESVGGMPTGAVGQNYSVIAADCGYKKVYCVEKADELETVLAEVRNVAGPVFVEIKTALKCRDDLGRPKESAVENKKNYMEYHSRF